MLSFFLCFFILHCRRARSECTCTSALQHAPRCVVVSVRWVRARAGILHGRRRDTESVWVRKLSSLFTFSTKCIIDHFRTFLCLLASFLVCFLVVFIHIIIISASIPLLIFCPFFVEKKQKTKTCSYVSASIGLFTSFVSCGLLESLWERDEVVEAPTVVATVLILVGQYHWHVSRSYGAGAGGEIRLACMRALRANTTSARTCPPPHTHTHTHTRLAHALPHTHAHLLHVEQGPAVGVVCSSDTDPTAFRCTHTLSR
jgi:hypothetical protein